MLDSRLASRLFSYLLSSLSVDQQACRGHDLWPLEGRTFHTLRLKAALHVSDGHSGLSSSAVVVCLQALCKAPSHVSSVSISFMFMVAHPVIKRGLLARYCSV